MKKAVIKRADVGALELGYLEQGKGPLVLCVHGFPDTAFSFQPLMKRLADAGYRAVAPFLRGYSPSDLAPDGDYRLPTVATDLVGLVEALGESKVMLVGHDWGGATSYLAATLFPEVVTAMVGAAIPHPRRFLLLPSGQQVVRSRYMGFFQIPKLPERTIPKDDFAWLRKLVREWSPRWSFTEEDLAPVIKVLSQPEHCAAALGYYRALPRALRSARTWQLLAKPVPVPAKVIFGSLDGCIGPEMFEGHDRCFSGGVEHTRIDGAGHFMHCEQPGRFADEVLAFLDQHRN